MSCWGWLFSRRKHMMEDLDQDIRDFIERETQDNIERGISPEEARYAALRKFGNVTRVKEETWDVWSFVWLEQLWQDIRFGLRMLVKNPGFTAVAVLSLALGIGANTAIFSLVNATLLRALPYPDPGRLVEVSEVDSRSPGNFGFFSETNFLVCAETAKSFSAMGAIHTPYAVSIDSQDRPERLEGQRVTSGIFASLGVPPLLGRYFVRGDDPPDTIPQAVVVISYNLWRRRFGGDPSVIGQKIPVEGRLSTILGVMPPGFSIFEKRDADVWFPNRLEHPVPGHEDMTTYLRVIARLKPGVTLEQANAELAIIGQRLAEQYPSYNKGMTLKARKLRESYSEGSEQPLLILTAAVGFVLLIACANVAGLMMVRATTRNREVAIRSAIGASRLRLARQFLTESVLLALAGGALGVLLALLGGRVLTISFSGILDPQAFDLDYRVLSYTLAVSLLTGLVFGLVPAVQGTRSDLRGALNEGGRGGATGAVRQRTRNALVVTQVALAVVLLVGAGLMINSLVRLQRVNPGFDASNLVTFQIQLPRDTFARKAPGDDDFLDYSPAIPALFDDVLARLKLLPGVESSGGATWLPLNNFWNEGRSIRIAGRPQVDQSGRPIFALYNTITPGFLRTMRIPLLRGRDIAETDAATSPWVVLINKTMADQYWPGTDPIGDTITAVHMIYPEKPREVIGIVADVHDLNLGMKPIPAIYIPHEQQPACFHANRQRSRLHMTYALRTHSRPADLVPLIKAAVSKAAPTQAIYDVKMMEQFIDEGTSGQRYLLTLLGIFGAIALLLSAVGIYGVMAYSVVQRTQEIGIRIAMGAAPRAVLGLILRRGAALALMGLVVGLGGAYGLTRFMGGWLYGVTPTDPATFAAASATLAAVALLACLVPALRATRVDPVAALRSG